MLEGSPEKDSHLNGGEASGLALDASGPNPPKPDVPNVRNRRFRARRADSGFVAAAPVALRNLAGLLRALLQDGLGKSKEHHNSGGPPIQGETYFGRHMQLGFLRQIMAVVWVLILSHGPTRRASATSHKFHPYSASYDVNLI